MTQLGAFPGPPIEPFYDPQPIIAVLVVSVVVLAVLAYGLYRGSKNILDILDRIGKNTESLPRIRDRLNHIEANLGIYASSCDLRALCFHGTADARDEGEIHD